MEIEVKARPRNRDAILAKLIGMGCHFSDSKTQDDRVWVKKTGSIGVSPEDHVKKGYDIFMLENGKD